MALEDYRGDMETCTRCYLCKFVPLERVRGAKYVNICPSVAHYNFHAYSAGGRLAAGTALLDKRISYSEKLAEVIYNFSFAAAAMCPVNTLSIWKYWSRYTKCVPVALKRELCLLP